jgi:PmbA protein
MSEVKLNPITVGESAVSAAMQAGAEHAEAYVRFASELKLDVRDGDVERVRRATSRGLGLRVTQAGRAALVHTTDLVGIPLLQLAVRAVEIARTLPPASDPVVFAPQAEIDAFSHPDPGLANEPLETRIERMKAVELAMLAVPGVSRSSGVGWQESDGDLAIVNSNGLKLYSPFCRIEATCEAIADDGEDSYAGGRYIGVPARKNLIAPERMGREAGERAAQLRGARTIASTRAPVIFTPQTGWALLAALVGPLRGDNVARQRSYLADQLGREIAAPGVTIRDNPHLPEGPARRAFDAEGTPTRDIALIRAGKLGSFLTDLASAAKIGVPPGGNATRDSYASGLAIGNSNLYMEPGNLSHDEIIAGTERGLMLCSLSGWWVGLSPVNDSFSSAAMGIWIEKGKPAYPVRGITIAGSIREMLRSIDRIGNDLEFTGDTCSPTFRVGEMAISGA